MGFGSIWHWLIVLLIVLVLFGRGRIAEIMGDFGKGVRSFKQGIGEEDKPAARIEPPIAEPRPAAEPVADSQTTPTTASAPRSDAQG